MEVEVEVDQREELLRRDRKRPQQREVEMEVEEVGMICQKRQTLWRRKSSAPSAIVARVS